MNISCIKKTIIKKREVVNGPICIKCSTVVAISNNSKIQELCKQGEIFVISGKEQLLFFPDFQTHFTEKL